MIENSIYRDEKEEKISKGKKIWENFWIWFTGIVSISIIAMVVYLLVHIALGGYQNITWEFLTAAPSDGLTGGGIFPAIFGTALLVIIMSIAGVPIGAITAIYLTEYAKETSKIARIIRFAVNTLAGVPAIVFGLFGLGFFIGTIGRQMDNVQMMSRISDLNSSFQQSDSPFKDDGRASAMEIKGYLQKIDTETWSSELDNFKSMNEIYPDGKTLDIQETVKFFKERQRPKWGQPSLLWAALTLALLTLPVVIVSVEEAIKTVPRDLREASLALGATKFQTIIRVVLPGSVTGILTGAILAVSRGAGEVAPILFTGAAYFLPDLPGSLSSQFMELGYHIYILTTQSTNVDLTRPLQYATTLVLLILTFTLNFSAIFLRSKVRAKMARLN